VSVARKSAKYIFIGNLISKIITFIGSIVLARILFPEDYGYLLMAMTVTMFAQTLANMGFENYYLQETIKDTEHEKKILNITFKIRMILNTSMFFIQFFGSYLVAKCYHQEVVGELLRLFSFNYIISGAVVVNLFILRKKLNYKPETLGNVSRDIIGTIVKVSLALMGLGVLSFAYGSIVGNLVRSTIILYHQPFKIRLNVWDNYEFKNILYFGKHSLIGGIGNYFAGYIDKILVSKFFTPYETGNYYFANTQSAALYNYTVYPQNSLFLSYVAKYKTEPSHLLNVLSIISYMIGILSLPILIFLIFYTDTIFQVVFGEKWNNSIVLFQMFLVYNYLKALLFPLMPILTGFGYPQIVSKLSVIRLLVLTVTLFILLQFTSNIYYYALVYMMIVLFFDLIKSAFGLKIMKYSISLYLKKIGVASFAIITTILWSTLYISQTLPLSDSEYLHISFGLLVLITSTLIIYYFFQKKQIVLGLELFLGKNHKLVKIITKL